MNRTTRLLTAALATAAFVTTVLATATPADAHRFWRPWHRFGFGFGFPAYYIPPPPPVYAVPRVAYIPPPPPPPVYYGYRYRVVHRYYRPVRHHVHRVVHKTASCTCNTAR